MLRRRADATTFYKIVSESLKFERRFSIFFFRFFANSLVVSITVRIFSSFCFARFEKLKQEKVVTMFSCEKTIGHACFQENLGYTTRALQLVSACCLRFHEFGEKSQLCGSN